MDSVILMDGCGFPKFHALLSFAVFKGSTPLSEAKDCCLRGFPQGLFSKAGAETRALVLRQGPCMVMSLNADTAGEYSILALGGTAAPEAVALRDRHMETVVLPDNADKGQKISLSFDSVWFHSWVNRYW